MKKTSAEDARVLALDGPRARLAGRFALPAAFEKRERAERVGAGGLLRLCGKAKGQRQKEKGARP